MPRVLAGFLPGANPCSVAVGGLSMCSLPAGATEILSRKHARAGHRARCACLLLNIGVGFRA